MAAPVFVSHFISVVNGPGLVMLSAAANKIANEPTSSVTINHLLPKRLVKVQCPGGVWTYQSGAKRLEV